MGYLSKVLALAGMALVSMVESLDCYQCTQGDNISNYYFCPTDQTCLLNFNAANCGGATQLTDGKECLSEVAHFSSECAKLTNLPD